MILAWASLAALLGLAFCEATAQLVSACKWLLERSAHADRDSSRPLRGSLPGEGVHGRAEPVGPDPYRSTHGRLLSSPVPARCTRELGSRGEPS